jgi:hypothetical protein
MAAGAPFGNTNATRGKILTEALKRALARSADGDLAAGCNKVAQAAVDAALAGEQWAIKEIWDRLEGKSAQSLFIGNDDGQPFAITRIERAIIDPTN